MSKEKRVTLLEPISGHGELIREVVLREPRYKDYFSLGEPYVIAQNADGSALPVESPDAIQAYLERCVVSPEPLLLAGLGLADAMAVKGALLSFFAMAQVTPRPSAT